LAIDGIINLDKPKGKTSFEVVAAVRRLSGERRVGHGGTLDPEATGVLPIFLGKATRLAEFVAGARKEYLAEIELGVSTDTYDAAGKIVGRGDVSALSREDVEAAAISFVGIMQQLPPAYSAVKYKGVPLYRWIRSGIEVPRKPREIEFYRIVLLEWKSPVLVIEVECSKGAYIRTLAQDIGENLRCGGHIKNLTRIRSGPFHLSDGITMTRVETVFAEGEWASIVQPMDVAVSHLPAITVDGEEECAIVNGRMVARKQESESHSGFYRVYSEDGRFIAIVSYDEAQEGWQPRKVFNTGHIKS
jgi:tRNA pseudouridine55 synthase